MVESKLSDLSIDCLAKVIKPCDNIKGHHSLAKPKGQVAACA